MNLEDTRLSEISQLQKGKYFLISLVSKIVKHTEAESRMVVARGREEVEMRTFSMGIKLGVQDD